MDIKNYFRPIIGDEEKILKIPAQYRNGLFGIASDTNRIYYGKDDLMHLIGSKSNIYYGQMVLTETPDDKQTEFPFNLEQIEGNEQVEDGNYVIPNEDDLILNIPDGCFYKVTDILQSNNAITLNTTKLTISGTGGNTSGPTGSAGSFSFNRITKQNIEVLHNAPCEIWYSFSAVDATGEDIPTGQVEVIINGISAIKEQQPKGDNHVEIGKYLSLAESQKVTIKLTLDMGTGVPKVLEKTWYVTTRNIALDWPYKETTINKNDTIQLSWTVKAPGKKTTYIIINGDTTNPILVESESTTPQTYAINRRERGLNHGVHKITMYVQANTDSGTLPPTEPITKNFICADKDEKSVIIANLLETNTVKQYDTLKIPLVIYNPDSDISTVKLYNDVHDTIPVDTWELGNGIEKSWLYTPTVASDEKRIKVSCGATNLIIVLNVISIGANIGEAEGYTFKLKASDLTSDEALRALTKENGDKLLTFSNNFDWIRGGLRSEKDENGNNRQYICIPAGSTMTINQALLAKEAAVYGKNIKIIFKAVNCRNYDGLVMKCGNALTVNAQSSTLKSTTTATSIPYCEDSYLELEYDIWAIADKTQYPEGADDKYRYIVGWLDGVPCCASTYIVNTYFADSGFLTVGSPDCDVYLYLVKTYDRHLDNEEHIKNFIADAPNSNEMLARHNRNDIIDDKGEISYIKLAQKAPNCKVHVYDIPRMTLTKDDKVAGCSYSMYQGSPEAIISSKEKVTIRVQGTSSAAYGKSAFNLDSDFSKAIAAGHFTKEELTDAVLGDKAIPCDYFTTKVNVASCEGANNALNQEWYNLHQPHKMNLRKKNQEGGWEKIEQVTLNEEDYKPNTYYTLSSSGEYIVESGEYSPNKVYYAKIKTGRLYRDTMQFEPGVLFITDRNPVIESNAETDVGDNVFKEANNWTYTDNPYPKLYSVCNMGNSKKNIEVFHDINNPRECCVEVSDNQLPEQRMLHFRDAFKWNPEKYAWTSLGIDGKTDAKIFEFRYPDAKDVYNGDDETQKANLNQMREDWTRFFTWMNECNLQPYHAENNPEGYDETKELDHPVTFETFTVSQPGILKGTPVSTFAKEYKTDCKQYRLAKMLSECEDYLCLDSVIYHYLMIERHSMIDNVAKNTFWSTEDGIHWNLNKDYDNDTADGIDNNGLLKLNYGVEGGDVDSSGTSYFNAGTTVWFNFVKELLPLQTAMYIALDKDHEDDFGNTLSSAWSASSYLTKFNDWQNCIPERCWIEDYYRKYFRPAEIHGDPTYLPRLDGGKKTHQRKQYETYQHNYIDSKFGGKTTLSGSIYIRANAATGDISVPLKFYADCYLNAAIGSGTGEQTAINYRRRVKRNEEVNFSFAVAGDLTDATGYFYLPQYYASIGDLSPFKLEVFSISGAKKLRELTLGDAIENNEEDAIITITDDAVPLLEKLIAKNIKDLREDSSSLDLTTAYSLKTLDLSGSVFKGVVLPNGAPLETIKLNKPTALTASNLYKINAFDIEDCSALTSIILDNVDGGDVNMSQTIVKELKDINSSELVAYRLRNIDWEIDDAQEIVQDGHSIPMFDYLLNRPENKDNLTAPHINQITGKVTIAASAYNNNDSLDFYNKYIVNGLNNDETKRYPKVDLLFNGDAKLCNVDIYYGDINDKRIWSKKAITGTTLNSDFLAGGPSGAFDFNNVSKDPSLQYTYTPTGTWNIYDADTNVLLNETPIADLTGQKFEINRNIRVIPIFTETIRKYPVTFYNDDNQTVLYDFSSDEDKWVPYGTTLKEVLDSVKPIIIPASTHNEILQLEETYMFKGYAVTLGSTFTHPDDYKIEGEENFYAVYEKMNIYDTDFSKYFRYENIWSDNAKDSVYIDPIDEKYNIYSGEGYCIKPNRDYIVNGKILIPTHYNKKPIVALSDFRQDQGLDWAPCPWDVTHVFLAHSDDMSHPLVTIYANSFYKCSKFKYFDFRHAPNLRDIGQQAFYNSSLDPVLTGTLGGPNTCRIDNRAFASIGSHMTDTAQVIQIPSSVVIMGHQALSITSAIKATVNIGIAPNLSQLDLEKSMSSVSDNFPRIIATNINFYTQKYTEGSDIVYDNSEDDKEPQTVATYLQSTNLHFASKFDVEEV